MTYDDAAMLFTLRYEGTLLDGLRFFLLQEKSSRRWEQNYAMRLGFISHK